MKRTLILAFAAVAVGYAQAQPAPDTLDEVTREYEALLLTLNPARASEREYNTGAAWPDASATGTKRRAQRAKKLRQRLRDLPASPGPDAAILDELLTGLVTFDEHNERYIPFTGDSGFHSEPTYVISAARIRNEDDAKDIIHKLKALDLMFAEHITNMREALAIGYAAYSDPLETTMQQVAEQIVERPEDSPLYAPFTRISTAISPERADEIRRDGKVAVLDAIAAYRMLDRFFKEEYRPRTQAGIVSLPGARETYRALVVRHTTRPDLTPDKVHQIGLDEVARIRSEMERVIAETGFDGTFEEFLTYLRTDPKFYAKSPEDLLEKAAEISKRLDAILPRYFSKLPRLPYGVRPVPAEIAPGYTTGRYVHGNMERGVAGTYLVNTYALDQRPLYQLPALSAHEAVPGHHLQIALSQELENVADFRRSYYSTAFGEGWGLYAEYLAGEAGIYRTPYERFGALSYEMWRACRLVADTGLHWYGWSREEAEKCFVENSALAPHNIKTEVTRYIGWPGQALGYKIGEITIRELRSEAKAALGDAFDIRAFHDVVLEDGAVPLPVLDQNVRRWIAEQLPVENTMTGTP